MDQLMNDIQAWHDAPGIRIIDGRRMKCQDVPDQLFLDIVRAKAETYGTTTFRVHAALEETLGPIPPRLFLAKARKLIESGKLRGCGCGCRGDFELPTNHQT